MRLIPIHVSVSETLAERATKLAHTLGTTRSAWLRQLLEEACDELEHAITEHDAEALALVTTESPNGDTTSITEQEPLGAAE